MKIKKKHYKNYLYVFLNMLTEQNLGERESGNFCLFLSFFLIFILENQQIKSNVLFSLLWERWTKIWNLATTRIRDCILYSGRWTNVWVQYKNSVIVNYYFCYFKLWDNACKESNFLQAQGNEEKYRQVNNYMQRVKCHNERI